jgi:hypothetical protein
VQPSIRQVPLLARINQPQVYVVVPAGLLHGVNESFVVPRVHRGPFDRVLLRENDSDLRPEVSAEAFRFNSGENHREIENPRSLGQGNGVVDDLLAIKIAGAKKHLRLMIYQRNQAVVGRQ